MRSAAVVPMPVHLRLLELEQGRLLDHDLLLVEQDGVDILDEHEAVPPVHGPHGQRLRLAAVADPDLLDHTQAASR